MPVNLIIRNPLDRDAREFIQRANVTDAGARAALNLFVRGIKTLDLWDKVACWPLRSAQNTGTGTVLHSLGGLGVSTGTLVGGASWGVDGININAAAAQSISISPSPLSDFANGHSFFVVMKPTGPDPMATTNTNQWVATQGGGILLQCGSNGTGSAGGFMVNARVQAWRRPSNVGTGYIAVRNLFAFLATNAGAPNAASSYAAVGTTLSPTTTVGTAVTYSGTTMSIAADGTDGRNTSAFILVTAAQFNLSASLQTSLQSLYKATLGTGLGLP